MTAGAVVTLVVSAAVVASGTSAGIPPRTATARCADSVYQAPPSLRPPTYAALKVGPVVFNHLAPVQRHDVNAPTRGFPFYSVASFFNVFPTAKRGVTVSVTNSGNNVALVYGLSKPGDFSSRLRAGRATLADGPATVRFPLCHDSQTHAPLITQYGLSVLLAKPGCFTIRVSPIGSSKRYSGTVHVLTPTCR